jgi:ribonuclease P protein subunit POP4
MKMTASNILFHELIGLRVTVLESTNSSLNGLSGEIINETQQVINIRSNRGAKKIPNANVTLSIDLPSGQPVKVDGKKIVYRPEDRIRRMKMRR